MVPGDRPLHDGEIARIDGGPQPISESREEQDRDPLVAEALRALSDITDTPDHVLEVIVRLSQVVDG
jgi:hypothetical protein